MLCLFCVLIMIWVEEVASTSLQVMLEGLQGDHLQNFLVASTFERHSRWYLTNNC